MSAPWFEYQEEVCAYCFRLGRIELFIYKRSFWEFEHWPLDGKRAFGVVTPWFVLFPW